MKLVSLAFVPYILAQFIEVRFGFRPVYISRRIDSDHVGAIRSAMGEFNRYATLFGDVFVETHDTTTNHIRIQYSEYNGCSMSAVTVEDGFFQVRDTIIGFQNELDPTVTKCVLLHELGHALGLAHSNETGSIMYPFISPVPVDTCMLNKNDLWNVIDGTYSP